MIKKIEATIPCGQYANIRPSFEYSTAEEKEEALAEMASLWDRFGESKLNNNATTCNVVEVETFTGEVVLWDEENHKYTDTDGKKLLSGSKYAAQQSKPFPKEIVLPKMVAKTKVSGEVIESIWRIKSSASLDLGNSIHKALETYHLYHVDGAKIQEANGDDENYALPKHPYLRSIVSDFVEKFGADALSEVVVSDVKNGRAGTIDRLVIVDKDKKICRVEDYKSNAEIKKPKLLEYQKQLSFYAHILINKGWTVEGLTLYKLDKEQKWESVEMEVLDIEK